jgi:hypothetical protein
MTTTLVTAANLQLAGPARQGCNRVQQFRPRRRPCPQRQPASKRQIHRKRQEGSSQRDRARSSLSSNGTASTLLMAKVYTGLPQPDLQLHYPAAHVDPQGQGSARGKGCRTTPFWACRQWVVTRLLLGVVSKTILGATNCGELLEGQQCLQLDRSRWC